MENVIIEISKIVLGVVAGYLLKAWLDKKAEIETREYKAKEKRYQKLLDLARVYYQESQQEEFRIEIKQKQQFVRELQVDAWLYASDKVLEKANLFLDQLDEDYKNAGGGGEKTAEYLQEMAEEIRKDLRKSKSSPKYILRNITLKDQDSPEKKSEKAS